MEIADLFDVKDKVVLVTGGSRGVGRYIAQAFVENYAKVYITNRNSEQSHRTAVELNKLNKGKCYSIPADLSKVENIIKFVEEFNKHETRLDVLVNNAGAAWGEPLEKHSEKGFDKILTLNLKGIFFLTQKLLPHLINASKVNMNPNIINIGSIQGILAFSTNTFAYDASKAAVHHLTKSLANVLSKSNIRVNAIALGYYKTKMNNQNEKFNQFLKYVPLKREGKDYEIGGVCLFLASKAASYITGAIVSVDGGVAVSMMPNL